MKYIAFVENNEKGQCAKNILTPLRLSKVVLKAVA
jgi:hypothetical protein